jgi:glycine hydroxymethyltransferase
VVPYTVDRTTQRIDMNQVEALAREHRPKLIIAGGSAYARHWDFARFRAICDAVNAFFVVDIAHFAGLVAGGAHPSPFPHAHVVTTTTHKTLRGSRGGLILSTAAHAKKIDGAVFPGLQGGPHMNNIAGAAITFKKAAEPQFIAYAQATLRNAKALAAALLAAGVKLITGGTDNHLLVIDTVASFGLDGRAAEEALDRIGITTNKQIIPDDPRPPLRPSGLRLGTPACTTHGMNEDIMATIAQWIVRTLRHPNDPAIIEATREDVKTMCRRYPVPGIA